MIFFYTLFKRDGADLMEHGKVFHSFDAEHVNDLSTSAIRDLGTASEHFQKTLADVYRFSKAVVPVLVLLFVAVRFILRGGLLYVFPCVILFLCFSVLLVFYGLCLFRFVGFLFLLGSGKGCGLWLWHFLDFSLTFFETGLSISDIYGGVSWFKAL